MSTRKRAIFSGSLRRLTIWALLIATWEAGYRLIGWEKYTFPAPSSVLDGTLALFNINTTFGEPLHARWPGPKRELYPAEQQGISDFRAGTKKLEENPYELGTIESTQWRKGFESGGDRWWNSPLAEALLFSTIRLLIGFVISIAVGAMIGILTWRFAAIDDFFGPLLLGIQTLPSVCWVPLAIIFFGINEWGILFVLTMGSFSAVAIALRDGLRAIPPLYQQAGRMMGAKGWRLYYYVLLPAALPALATSLRQGFSFAWRSLMGAELILIVAREGLGRRLYVARDTGAVEQVIALLVIMILFGMLADRWVFAQLQKRVSVRFGLAPR